MPIIDALVIAAIVSAFIVFAAGLAWGEYQTRSTSREKGGKKHAAAKTQVLEFRRQANQHTSASAYPPLTRKPSQGANATLH